MSAYTSDLELEEALSIIARYDKEYSRWMASSQRITQRYRGETNNTVSSDLQSRYNILWSNVQTLMPACYARTPKPDVSRRFDDRDEVGRVASQMIQRALAYEMTSKNDFSSSARAAVQDRFVGGRGTVWVRYDPYIAEDETSSVEEQYANGQVTEDSGLETNERIEDECTPVDYIDWRDFGHEVARTWEEVTKVWRIAYMSREDLIERFGEELGKRIPMAKEEGSITQYTGFENAANKAAIYELWDACGKKVYWLAKGWPEFLDVREDPLELDGFFPCPKPLYATLTADTLVPVPDYSYYQDQAQTLDLLVERIKGLVDMIKLTGVYDAAFPTLQRLFTENTNGNLIPVNNWGSLSEKGGLSGAFQSVDIANVAQALDYCYAAVEQIKREIYEITGLSDVLRGVSDPRETAEAQQKKGNFASLRLIDTQTAVAEFASEIIRLKAQIICKHYQPETILRISCAGQMNPADIQLIPQALMLIKNDLLNNFRIQVDADTLVVLDEEQMKRERVEFINAFGALFQQSLPVIQAAPQAAPLLLEIMKFGVGAYKGAESIEGAIDTQLDQLQQDVQKKAMQPPPPNPDMLKIQAQSQAKQQEMQMDYQLDLQRAQIEQQTETHRQQVQAQQASMETQAEMIRDQRESELNQRLEVMKMSHDAEMQAMRAQIDILIAKMNNSAKLEVADMQMQGRGDNV